LAGYGAFLIGNDMLEFKDLNPLIQEAIEIATEGLPLMDAARLRHAMIRNLEKESLCGIAMTSRVVCIIEQVLLDEIKAIERRLADLTNE